MQTDWTLIEGSPIPLGVSYNPIVKAYNVALYSNHAAKVSLLLYAEEEYELPRYTIVLNPLINKSQRVWHCYLKESEIPEAAYYAFQVDGPVNIEEPYWHAFNPKKVLLDPYTKAIFFPPEFSRLAACDGFSNAGKAALGCLRSLKDAAAPFDWQNDKPVRHTDDLIIYEMHVRGFTRRASAGVPVGQEGTFAGVIAKIPYLKDLGITAVELMPVFQFDPQENNYWGYMPLGFFMPHLAYSSDKTPGGAMREFKTMVRELHKAGIEVILDVVFNHTVEGGKGGPVYHFKGIDNSTYYLLKHTPNDPYLNYSGTGNTLRTDHPATQQFIMDCLRYWVTEMHVDGFRFDLASVFSRTSDGRVGDTPIFAQLAADPVLSSVRMIAEPWDAVDVYQLGRAFPGVTWLQWNGKFRDDVRQFVKSDAGFVGALIQRLYGSDDLFPGDAFHAYHSYQSVNYINSHDGFTLYDTVAYNSKHNQANGHNNTDGHEPNLSWNCGIEGDMGVSEAVMQLRQRQAKNFFTLLMLSNGTPMFVAGDEFLHTQNGNNNAYNQDNETSWLNWNRLDQFSGFHQFIVALIRFRKEQDGISRSRFWRNDVRWYGVNGQPDFQSSSRSLAFSLKLSSGKTLYVMINAYWEGLPFVIQEPGPWSRIINTYLASGEDILKEGTETITHSDYWVGERSIVVLLSNH
ncbi:isoamylase [Xanthocytophaga agilis]|uniref:Isoamylase n=1 Tax=Xanthocytophaga agilis TaxID=3048010 RepID=A0AAE3RED3_9BACT|nr:isoamylase [Xanthocytophaga agilis]MDJ1506408.1 isoamylase [Xanthocytophaga agilis]